MRIGRLDKRISIHARDSDSKGVAGITALALVTVWAKVMDISGDEQYEADREIGLSVLKFLVRYEGVSACLDSTRVVKYRDQYYDVRHVWDADPRSGEMQFTARLVR